MNKKMKDVMKQAAELALSTVGGAVTKSTITPRRGFRCGTATQVGYAIGPAAAQGAGVSGSLGAGAAILTAKVAAGTAAATAAAPIVAGAAIVGGIGYGIYKLFK